MLMKKIFASVLLIAVASCATTYEAKINFDKNSKVDTLNYKTFAWLTSAKIMAAKEDINPVMKLRVDEKVEQAFIAKGYQLIDDAEKADFAISYTVGNRDKIKTNSYPTTYRSGFGWGRGYYGGRVFGAHISTESRVRHYTEGKLAIDVYDVKSHQPAWHGWAVKRITGDDKEVPSATITDIVDKVVAQFH